MPRWHRGGRRNLTPRIAHSSRCAAPRPSFCSRLPSPARFRSRGLRSRVGGLCPALRRRGAPPSPLLCRCLAAGPCIVLGGIFGPVLQPGLGLLVILLGMLLAAGLTLSAAPVLPVSPSPRFHLPRGPTEPTRSGTARETLMATRRTADPPVAPTGGIHEPSPAAVDAGTVGSHRLEILHRRGRARAPSAPSPGASAGIRDPSARLRRAEAACTDRAARTEPGKGRPGASAPPHPAPRPPRDAGDLRRTRARAAPPSPPSEGARDPGSDDLHASDFLREGLEARLAARPSSHRGNVDVTGPDGRPQPRPVARDVVACSVIRRGA